MSIKIVDNNNKLLKSGLKDFIHKPYYLVALGFGIGLVPKAPGTFGSLLAILIFPFLILLSHYIYYLLGLSILIFLGVFVCNKVSKDININDHNAIVWDEMVGMWITLLIIRPLNCCVILIGFLLFRIIDIVKPWPINLIDRYIQNGVGIMLDDICAGILSGLLIQVFRLYQVL